MWWWQKIDQIPLFQKRMFVVILIESLANGMGQTLGRGHQYRTE